MNRLDLQTAQALIDFSGDGAIPAGMAQQQLAGTVALHNMLADRGMAYLADEVGMGKTYIGLGVVALMRRFQPALRVLYLLPKNNVRDKWQKDYRSFVDRNYRLHDGIVKGLGNAPAAPFRVCQSLPDLVQAVATDSARDYFICTSAFSLPLGKTRDDLVKALTRFRQELPQNTARIDELMQRLTQEGANEGNLGTLKLEVKRSWAEALNAILPRFDLLVVDEAHNYRRGIESSDRNQLLAAVLGTVAATACRADRVLLLSATPFDRALGQLQRQLQLFGKQDVLDMPEGGGWGLVHAALAPFMVRRLNSLMLDGKDHTRNMYRTEHRSGGKAEIGLGLEQQLFAAVLQKKVSECLNENHSGKFELGMLASFESYLPSNKGKPVLFDGDDEGVAAGSAALSDAADRTVVEYLVDDYQRCFNEFPPHPKMDHVAREAGAAAFQANKKQLIFVRRVGSVGELKAKTEDAYNRWLRAYLAEDGAVTRWFGEYDKLVADRQHSQLDNDGEEDRVTPDSFFTWFYRGNNAALEGDENNLLTTPHNYRNMLARASILFATNWSTLPGMPCPRELDLAAVRDLPQLPARPTRVQQFEHAQYAYLRAVELQAGSIQARLVARRILAAAYSDVVTVRAGDTSGLHTMLDERTLWEVLRDQPALAPLCRDWSGDMFDMLAGDDDSAAERRIRLTVIHHALAATMCRLDHPFIDLYSLRDTRTPSDDGSADDRLIKTFAGLLAEQSARPDEFSSFTVLRDLAEHLELLLKQNFEDVWDKKPGEFATYFANQLKGPSPVLGASGANASSRSAYARKFRMPGYPRVLVSTDVFQEGEDLHTFCDSVIHYGISANPISLEQKVGRVDRIGSLAHRVLHGASGGHANHFIQVGFPHIRQSLEFLQVRLAANNLNQFLRSMNRIGEEVPRPPTEVNLADELRDTSAIEPAIGEYLRSPFTITPDMLEGADRTGELEQAQAALRQRIAHGRQLVERVLSAETGQEVILREIGGRLQWIGAGDLAVALRGAYGSGQLLLSISVPGQDWTEIDEEASGSVLDRLHRLQASPLVRVQSPWEGTNPLAGRLRRNAEIYAGAAGILSETEVRDLYHRVTDHDSPAESATIEPQAVQLLVEGICQRYGKHRVEKAGKFGLDYHFELEQRRQRVQWQLAGSYLLLTSQVLDAAETAILAEHGKQLVQHTLRRNAVFDIVDFHIDDGLALAARALHPLHHLNGEELAFAALTVAREADRLRQILLAAPADEEDEDEAPVRARADETLRRWADDNGVICSVREVLNSGPCLPEDLIRNVAYALDYQRASSKIRLVREDVLRTAARRGITVRDAGMVRLLTGSITEYDEEHLKAQFLASISKLGSRFVERQEATVAFARWMGYRRTGPKIQEVAESLISKLLRAGKLERSGKMIRRSRGR
jgi:hypothetical protein